MQRSFFAQAQESMKEDNEQIVGGTQGVQELVSKVTDLLDQGLWDRAWRNIQDRSGWFAEGGTIQSLGEEVAVRARTDVPWWINPQQRKRLVDFAKRHKSLLTERETLAKKRAVCKMELLFEGFSHNLRRFCGQVSQLPESVWTVINNKAKGQTPKGGDVNSSRWPKSIREFKGVTEQLCDGIYGVVSDPALLSKDASAREIATAYLWAICELYDTDDPYTGRWRLSVLSGEEQPGEEMRDAALSDRTVGLLDDILHRVIEGRIFNRVACPIDSEGHVHHPDYLINLPKIGYSPLIELEGFIDLVNNPQAYQKAEVIPPTEKCPPVLVLHLNTAEGWKFSIRHAGDDVPEGEETRLRVLLFDGEQPTAKEGPYRDLIEGRKLRLDRDGTTVLAKALTEDEARIVMAHALMDARQFHKVFLAAAGKLNVSREIGDKVLDKIKAKTLRKVLPLNEVIPKLVALRKAENVLRRAHKYEASENLKQALRIIRNTLRNFPDNPSLLQEDERLSACIERRELIARAQRLSLSGKLGDKEKTLLDLEAFFCSEAGPITEDMMKKVYKNDTEALKAWRALADSTECSRQTALKKKLERIGQKLETLEAKISSADCQEEMEGLREGFGRVEKELEQVTSSVEKENLQGLFEQLSTKHKTKLQKMREEVTDSTNEIRNALQLKVEQIRVDPITASNRAFDDLRARIAKIPSVKARETLLSEVSEAERNIELALKAAEETAAASAVKARETAAEEAVLRYLVKLERQIDQELSFAELLGLRDKINSLPDDICDIWQGLNNEQKAGIAEMRDTVTVKINDILAERERSRNGSAQTREVTQRKNRKTRATEGPKIVADDKLVDEFMDRLPKGYGRLNAAIRNLVVTKVKGNKIREEALKELAGVLARMENMDPQDLGEYEKVLKKILDPRDPHVGAAQ